MDSIPWEKVLHLRGGEKPLTLWKNKAQGFQVMVLIERRIEPINTNYLKVFTHSLLTYYQILEERWINTH